MSARGTRFTILNASIASSSQRFPRRISCAVLNAMPTAQKHAVATSVPSDFDRGWRMTLYDIESFITDGSRHVVTAPRFES
jgi:hypothetical protein